MVEKLQSGLCWMCLLICFLSFTSGLCMFLYGCNMLHQCQHTGQIVEKHADRPLVTFRDDAGHHHVLQHNPYLAFPKQGSTIRVRTYGVHIPIINWYPTILDMDDGTRRY